MLIIIEILKRKHSRFHFNCSIHTRKKNPSPWRIACMQQPAMDDSFHDNRTSTLFSALLFSIRELDSMAANASYRKMFTRIEKIENTYETKRETRRKKYEKSLPSPSYGWYMSGIVITHPSASYSISEKAVKWESSRAKERERATENDI